MVILSFIQIVLCYLTFICIWKKVIAKRKAGYDAKNSDVDNCNNHSVAWQKSNGLFLKSIVTTSQNFATISQDDNILETIPKTSIELGFFFCQ